MCTRLGGSEFAREQELHDALSVTGSEPWSREKKHPLQAIYQLLKFLTEYFKLYASCIQSQINTPSKGTKLSELKSRSTNSRRMAESSFLGEWREDQDWAKFKSKLDLNGMTSGFFLMNCNSHPSLPPSIHSTINLFKPSNFKAFSPKNVNKD